MDIRHIYYIVAIVSMLLVATVAVSGCAPGTMKLPEITKPNWP
jgi:hypothetical protein